MIKSKTKSLSKVTTISISEDILEEIVSAWEDAKNNHSQFRLEYRDEDGNVTVVELENE